MAKLGVRTVDELVGRTDLLKAEKMRSSDHQARSGSYSHILSNPYLQ